jgi:hypothetical protein
MRLLQRSETGEIRLTKKFVSDVSTPPYAILSHTWGPDIEEVTFEEMTRGTGDTKNGYRKIAYCAEQAMRDGLEYFWVDTCCIDKSSSSELSEAINSMYAWYQRSTVCYVYLSDVTSKIDPPWILPADEHLEEDERIRLEGSDFAKSRWFTRGWTLQELLAPKHIEFYSKDWIRLGNLEELLAAVVHITKIDRQVLTQERDLNLSRLCVARKMSWAAKRQTSRIEDQAYCLMGIFEVHMPLLYGEGSHAFVRLQEEILKQADENSILAWQAPDHITELDFRPNTLLAPSPSYFGGCGNLIIGLWLDSTEPWLMSNLGLTIRITLTSMNQGAAHNPTLPPYFYAILDCRAEDDPDQRLALCGTMGQWSSKRSFRPWLDPSIRIKRVSQHQLDNEKRPTMVQSVLILGRWRTDLEQRMFAEPVIVALDTTLGGQMTTHHVITIKDHYPSKAWTDARSIENKNLVVTGGSSAEHLAAVRLTFRGENLLLVLRSISRSSLIDHMGMERPTLIRCPRGTHSMRFLISQISSFSTSTKSKCHVYDGPLSFRYMQKKDDKRCDYLILKAYVTTVNTRRSIRKEAKGTNPVTESVVAPDESTSAEVDALYKPLNHIYWPEN